jgi:hypothetical protein
LKAGKKDDEVIDDKALQDALNLQDTDMANFLDKAV